MPSSSAFLSSAEVRAFDHSAATRAGLPTRVLMESAGRGAAEVLVRLGAYGPVLVCCGKGNNGGDGLVLARHARAWGLDVRVLLFAEVAQLAGDAAENWRSLQAARVPARIAVPFDEDAVRAEMGRADWIVDALLGIGLTGPARSPLDRLIPMINAAPARVFALDLPSGLDADTGEPLGPTIRARHTATFVAPKKAFANPAASTWTGRVHVVSLGIERDALDAGRDATDGGKP